MSISFSSNSSTTRSLALHPGTTVTTVINIESTKKRSLANSLLSTCEAIDPVAIEVTFTPKLEWASETSEFFLSKLRDIEQLYLCRLPRQVHVHVQDEELILAFAQKRPRHK